MNSNPLGFNWPRFWCFEVFFVSLPLFIAVLLFNRKASAVPVRVMVVAALISLALTALNIVTVRFELPIARRLGQTGEKRWLRVPIAPQRKTL